MPKLSATRTRALVLPENRDILLSFDVDWAPDWMIADVVQRLRGAGVRATFFATHYSPLLRELACDPEFEVGIHPNLLPNSSQGDTPEEVFANLREWFPEARLCRTHSLVQSEPLLARMAAEFGIKIDCSIHLPRAAYVEPHWLELFDDGLGLVRLPHVFQDNMHVLSGRGWTAPEIGLDTPGWKVMNFHPVHVVQNTARLSDYTALKRLGALSTLDKTITLPLVHTGAGVGQFFDELLAALSGRQTWTISERVSAWQTYSMK